MTKSLSKPEITPLILNDDNSINIDKNFAFNILEFNNIENPIVRNITKSLLLYFSDQYQNDLFGYQILDLNKFSKKLNISKTILNRNVVEKNSLIVQDFNNTEWTTYLEQALVVLATKSIFKEYKGKIEVNSETNTYVGIKNFIVIKELVKKESQGKNGGKKKKSFQYVLDDNFERNLKEFFTSISLKNYSLAKKIHADDFYLYLKNIYFSNSSKGINSYRFNINYLLDYFNVKNPEIKKEKYKLNQIFKKFEVIFKEEIKGIQFFWIKANENCKYAYVPVVRWDLDLTEFKRLSSQTLDNVFLNDLRRSLLSIFKTQTNLSNIEFKYWFLDPSNNEIIKSTYVSLYLKYNVRQKYPTPEMLSNSFIMKRNELNGKNITLNQLFVSSK